jgi:rsbT co-antagonist protein RsbR
LEYSKPEGFVELQQLQQHLDGAARTIRTLSVPLISVGPAILALPLIGAFGVARMLELRNTTLDTVHRRRAKVLIVDCTGLEAIDGDTIRELIGTIEALALLGARTIICGVGAELARRLAEEGLGGHSLETALDMADGIARAQQLADNG